MLTGVNPALPAGTKVNYRCDVGHAFSHDWYAWPVVTLTCADNGQFQGIPDIWPICVNRKL